MKLLRKLLALSLVMAVHAIMTLPVQAQVKKIEVEITTVDPEARTITVTQEGKPLQLDISRKAMISVAGKEVDVSAVLPGDKATIEYHEDLGVVTKIEAAGSGGNGWKFYDVFNKDIDPDRAIIIARDGSLVCQGKVNGYCLASLREYSEFTFSVEFQYDSEKVVGGPFVSVSSSLPNPKAKDFRELYPFGIEVKLAPANIGELVLPKPDFKVELPLGQLRDQRKVVALRKPALNVSDWNKLEITCDQHRKVTVKINGTTVNAVAKAQTTTGHIVIFPQNAEMRFRNPHVVSGEEQTPLSFEAVQ
ncbi:DUF1080 domain-containing protein [Gimesia chilikensis]|uniref:family 16 glycoside hydrolase n=1 Tax=Gimesia chilikensis TaxID=2605989 RepID=UPI0011EF81D1|nr:family 16 glycoside hydrolase [Gimesia chilikensis]KAA0131579.1 DUF1080 domain-containing protein [Gimesia chilikensis]